MYPGSVRSRGIHDETAGPRDRARTCVPHSFPCRSAERTRSVLRASNRSTGPRRRGGYPGCEWRGAGGASRLSCLVSGSARFPWDGSIRYGSPYLGRWQTRVGTGHAGDARPSRPMGLPTTQTPDRRRAARLTGLGGRYSHQARMPDGAEPGRAYSARLRPVRGGRAAPIAAGPAAMRRDPRTPGTRCRRPRCCPPPPPSGSDRGSRRRRGRCPAPSGRRAAARQA